MFNLRISRGAIGLAAMVFFAASSFASPAAAFGPGWDPNGWAAQIAAWWSDTRMDIDPFG